MTKTINTTAINTAVRAALQAAHTYGARVEELKSELHGVEESQASNVITPAVAKFYGIEAVEGKRGLTFEGGPSGDDKTGTKAYMAAKAARGRLIKAVYGSASSASKAPAVQRFEKQRVEMIQGAIVGLTKAQAKAYFDKALAAAFA